jgi:hypothetical protein
VSGDLDYEANGLVLIEAELATLAAAWESTPPKTAASAAEAMDAIALAVGRGRPKWRQLRGRLRLLGATALTDMGLYKQALTAATDAGTLAASVHDDVTRAHAQVIQAEVSDMLAPGSKTAVAAAEQARERAGRSYVAPLAATTLAGLYAGRGVAANAQVLAVLESAKVLPAVPQTAHGFPLGSWSPGYLAAFGGSALVRAGALGAASTYLAEAAEAFGVDADAKVAAPGAATFVQLCRASGAMASGQVDEAAEYAGQALALAGARGSTAWLEGSLANLAASAKKRGAAWPLAEV